jgi:hypothetical protein
VVIGQDLPFSSILQTNWYFARPNCVSQAWRHQQLLDLLISIVSISTVLPISNAGPHPAPEMEVAVSLLIDLSYLSLSM